VRDQPQRLRGDRVTLRPASAADAPRFEEILSSAGVREWWGTWDRARVERELATTDEVRFAIDVEGEVVGLIQYWEEDEPDYRHAGMDLALDPAKQGEGLGPDALRTLARHLFEERGHHRLTIDPAVANDRAIRAYERVGFRPVGVMRRYERAPDGTWRDALLMDLLREELR